MKLITSSFNSVENNNEILNDVSSLQTDLINLFKDKGMMSCPRNSNRINESTKIFFPYKSDN